MERLSQIVRNLFTLYDSELANDAAEHARLVDYVERNFSVARDEGVAFDVILAEVAGIIIKHIARYGEGHSDKRGRTTAEYWLDEIGLVRIAERVVQSGGFPDRAILDVSPAPISSARKCAGVCNTKLEPGELRLVINTPKYRPLNATCGMPHMVDCSAAAFCLHSACVQRALSTQSNPHLTPIELGDATSMGSDGVRRMSEAACAVASTRIQELVGGDPPPDKPTARFPGDRKLSRKYYDDDRVPALAEDCPAILAMEGAAVVARENEIREAEEMEKERKRTKRLADDDRIERYGSAVEKFKDAAVPDDALCVVVMDSGPTGEPNFKCPYDRKDGSPFCSMCDVVMAAAAAKRA